MADRPQTADMAGRYTVHRVEVTDPSGQKHQRTYLHTVEVVILVVEHDGHVLFVREFRAAAGGEVLTLPMGKVDSGASPEQAAAAELAEETGYAAARLERLIGPRAYQRNLRGTVTAPSHNPPDCRTVRWHATTLGNPGEAD